jgi:hypothetical protein
MFSAFPCFHVFQLPTMLWCIRFSKRTEDLVSQIKFIERHPSSQKTITGTAQRAGMRQAVHFLQHWQSSLLHIIGSNIPNERTERPHKTEKRKNLYRKQLHSTGLVSYKLAANLRGTGVIRHISGKGSREKSQIRGKREGPLLRRNSGISTLLPPVEDGCRPLSPCICWPPWLKTWDPVRKFLTEFGPIVIITLYLPLRCDLLVHPAV